MLPPGDGPRPIVERGNGTERRIVLTAGDARGADCDVVSIERGVVTRTSARDRFSVMRRLRLCAASSGISGG